MVRPNGSVIGRDSDAKGLREGLSEGFTRELTGDPFIQKCLFSAGCRNDGTAPYGQSRHIAAPAQSASFAGNVGAAGQAISGWPPVPARGRPIRPAPPRSSAALAVSVSTFSSGQFWVADPPAGARRPPDRDRPSSSLARRNLRGYGSPAPEWSSAGTCSACR